MGCESSMPLTGTSRSTRGMATRPVPIANSSAAPSPARSAKKPTTGSRTSGANMKAELSSQCCGTTVEIAQEVPIDLAQEIVTAMGGDRLRDLLVHPASSGLAAEALDLLPGVHKKGHLRVASVRIAGGGLEPHGLVDARHQLRQDHVVAAPEMRAGHGNGKVAGKR